MPLSWDLSFQQEFRNYTVARDTFLAHLGATLWGSMRHVISPSLSDGAFHYYEKISFQFFFVTHEVCSVYYTLKGAFMKIVICSYPYFVHAES